MEDSFSEDWGWVGEGVDRRQSSGRNLNKASLAYPPLTHLLCGQFLTAHGLVLVCGLGVGDPCCRECKRQQVLFFCLFVCLFSF